MKTFIVIIFIVASSLLVAEETSTSKFYEKYPTMLFKDLQKLKADSAQKTLNTRFEILTNYSIYLNHNLSKQINQEIKISIHQKDLVLDIFDAYKFLAEETLMLLKYTDRLFSKEVFIHAKRLERLTLIIQDLQEHFPTDRYDKIKFPRNRLFDEFTAFVSGIFGNLVGAVRWRHGYLYKNQDAYNRIIAELRPLDIIAERTPFALTDFFIPGNFGHVALWLGTEKQLKEIGMWQHKMIRKYHKQIRAGNYIAEAIRAGTGLKTLEDFLEIDEIAIIRQRNVLQDKAEVSKIYTRALNQIGKKYDFNFDVDNSDKLICSELIYLAFKKILWPSKYTLGRRTITPDNVAELALWGNNPIHLEYYLFSKETNKLQEWNIFNLAKLIGYVPNPELSRPGFPKFDKKIKKCNKLLIKNITKVYCRYVRKHLIYKAPKEILE